MWHHPENAGTAMMAAIAFSQDDWFRNQANRRAPGTLSRCGGFTVDQRVYSVVRDSYGFELPDEVRDGSMVAYDMDRDGTLYATEFHDIAYDAWLTAISVGYSNPDYSVPPRPVPQLTNCFCHFSMWPVLPSNPLGSLLPVYAIQAAGRGRLKVMRC
jgi:hypothetical protein